MYTDEDLDLAVKQGIFKTEDVAEFRSFISQDHHSPIADEENVRLISSFNDIFVVIAISLFLYSIFWLGNSAYSPQVGMGLVTVASWGLAEFFIRRRKMALPAIVLVLCFAGSLFAAITTQFSSWEENSLLIAAATTVIATYAHWRRFRVPITVAAGAIAGLVFLITLVVSNVKALQDLRYLDDAALIAGVLLFALALWWDSKDLDRTKRYSDIAFWLHLSASPLIVHTAFLHLSMSNNSNTQVASIIALYLALTLISLVIDRRAFMVSALAYVLYALVDFMNSYGSVENSLAIVGVTIGFSLLVLSGFWHSTRKQVIRVLPSFIRSRVPS